jgi:hypothetical protein
MADWTLEALLLRRLDLHLAGANWQRGGGKGSRPKPVQLPNTRAGSTKFAGSDVAQRLRNLGLIPASD